MTPSANFGRPRPGSVRAVRPASTSLITRPLRGAERGLRYVRRLKELDPGEDNMLLRVTPSLKGTTTTMGGHPDAKPK